jgi:hypothetical protein
VMELLLEYRRIFQATVNRTSPVYLISGDRAIFGRQADILEQSSTYFCRPSEFVLCIGANGFCE